MANEKSSRNNNLADRIDLLIMVHICIGLLMHIAISIWIN